MKNRIIKCINDSISVKKTILDNSRLLHNIEKGVQKSIEVFRSGNKILKNYL